MGGTGPGMWTGSVARDAASCPQWTFPGSVGAGGGFVRGGRMRPRVLSAHVGDS